MTLLAYITVYHISTTQQFINSLLCQVVQKCMPITALIKSFVTIRAFDLHPFQTKVIQFNTCFIRIPRGDALCETSMYCNIKVLKSVYCRRSRDMLLVRGEMNQSECPQATWFICARPAKWSHRLLWIIAIWLTLSEKALVCTAGNRITICMPTGVFYTALLHCKQYLHCSFTL